MATLSLIRDGSIEIWSGGSPANQNVQTTNTTLTQLTRDMSPTHPARLVMPTALGHGESLVKDGQSALRATIAAAGAADEFRIWSPGAIVAALTGATTNPLNFLGSLVGPTSSATSYDWGEGSLRYVDAATSHNVVELKQYWKKYSFAFEVPPTDPNGVQIEHLVWQISNDSAGAQVIDLDDIAFGSLLAQEEVSADG
jgi:hypothetical protein